MEGNTIILKPSRETSCTANKIAEYAHKAGFPLGVINVVHGSCGDLLVKHPDTHVVLFVGSNDVGSEIKKIVAGFHDKMCACEMGGKNALIVLDDANLNIAVNAAIISAFKTSGQRCTSASRLIVHEKVLSEFEKRFVETAKRLRIGNPLDEDVFMGPVINQSATEKIARYNELAKKKVQRCYWTAGGLPVSTIKKVILCPHLYIAWKTTQRAVCSVRRYLGHM